MNTLGKILVILNLLFTLALAGLHVFFAAKRERFGPTLEAQKREVIAANAAREGNVKVMATLDAKYKTAVTERNTAKNNIVDLDAEYKVKLLEKENEIDTKVKELEKMKVSFTKMQEEIDRRNEEAKNLGIALKNRETTILDLEGKTKFFQAQAIDYKNKAESVQARNEVLLAKNRELEILYAKSRTGAGTGGTTTATGIKLPNEPNPPSSLVKGTIDRVDAKDPGTVQLSVGSDHGLAANHTLYAYRMDPEPTYLGLVRIVEVHHHSAVGRLERTSVSRPIPLRAGDKVSSDLKYR